MTSIIIIPLIFFFLYGICLGSFLNVVNERIIKEERILNTSRSKCEACGQQLKPFDLIPIFSYLFLKGKCRYCHATYGVSHLLTELMFGASFVGIFLLNQNNIEQAIFLCGLFCVLYCICYIDYKTMYIYNVFLYLLIIFALINVFHFKATTISSALIGAICISFPLFVLSCLIPNSFGQGDVQLFAISGFLIGWKLNVLTFFISLIVATIFIIIKKMKGRNEKELYIAYGPAITIAMMISILFGTQIIQWYLGLFML